MKVTSSKVVATTLVTGASAMPSNTKRQSVGCDSGVTLDPNQNPFESYTLYANNFYHSKIEAAIPDMSTSVAAKAEKVANVGSFLWAVILPHLLMVLTFSTAGLSDWDPLETTAAILDEQNLAKLDSMIQEAGDLSRAKKTEARMLFPTDIQEKILKMAFRHHADTLQEPFDFLEHWISIRPPEKGFAMHFFNFRKAAERARPTDLSCGNFCAAVTASMCSVIALDIYRSLEYIFGTVSDIYKGKILDSTHIDSPGGENSGTGTYQSQMEKGVSECFDPACHCEYIAPLYTPPYP
ncbi:hypothetical protein MKZ38_001519 [Zalerion maritima]|uniref:Uncharacterized protein n=1 Tax=Zalerion maritima TaxID=339359 RepID=A0AAD5RRR3_9PEZI|nr:hypothetical protein MKZ38_001519 [Zalerion maritima]